MTSALIRNTERIFGYDAYPSHKSWHLHPVGNPEDHVNSIGLTIAQIVNLYAEVIVKINKIG